MKILLLTFVCLLQVSVYAQLSEIFVNDILLEDELKVPNVLEEYLSYDFSTVWLKNNNEVVYGIIGEDHQRIHIKLLSVAKNPHDFSEYIVYGKSMVNDNVCDFSGIIKLVEVKEVKELHYGVDREYADKGIKLQGLLFAKYSFFESKGQELSGKFEGDLISKWYLNVDDQIAYDDIQFIADGYINNAFVGKWTSYSSKLSKICRWADFRVPMVNDDFDIGTAEFSVSEKYKSKGWDKGSFDFVNWWK